MGESNSRFEVPDFPLSHLQPNHPSLQAVFRMLSTSLFIRYSPRLKWIRTNPINPRFSSNVAKPFKKVTVIGAGLMGSGVAQVIAQAGISVTLHGIDDPTINQARSIITQSLNRIGKKKFLDDSARQKEFTESTLSNLETSTEIERSVEGDPDLIVEAIVEKIESKRELFGKLDKVVRSDQCIFASNTSSLKIGDISSAVSTQRQTRFAGLHFFNPVPQMKLVEIIRTPETSEETLNRLTSLCQQIGKTPVNCKDTPGFIVNRLLVPYLLEAMRMLERGEANAEDIDTAMKLGAGHPMGPIALSDYVGLDTMKFISDGWRHSRVSTGEIDPSLVSPVETLDQLVQDKKFGLKTKHGFYKY